jgi:polysaccharide biosynthesis transport protein
MQPIESYNVTRRALDVEDYIDIVRRHKGWIFGPFLLAVVGTVVGVYLWPDSYISQAKVMIVPQQLPENMVQSSINQEMFDRINSMEQEILSRTTLTTIINTFGLYPREKAREPIEDVIDQMKKQINIAAVAPVGSTNHAVPAFVVQFSYENRYLAQRVVQDLVGKFIDINIRNRSNATFQTTQFMKDELDQAKKELDGVEGKLAEFRTQNNGRLPDQAESNMRQLAAMQAQVTLLDASISRATEDKLQLESNLRIYQEQLTALSKEQPVESAAAAQKNERLAEAEHEIQNLENNLSVLRQHYSESYPDVQTAIGHLAVAKQERDEILKDESSKKPEEGAPKARPVNPQMQREARDLDASIQRMQSSIEAKDLEVQQYNKEMKRANDAIKSYTSRLDSVPLGEKQYGDLIRDRDIARQKYVELDNKLSRAEISKEMEERKEGEMLELLDPPSLPVTPAQPKRPLAISIGAGLGLLLGIVIAGAREMKDTSLKNLKDVRAYTQMAILGSIPLLENDFVVRRRRRLNWLGWTTACLAAAVVISGSIVYYYVSRV